MLKKALIISLGERGEFAVSRMEKLYIMDN